MSRAVCRINSMSSQSMLGSYRRPTSSQSMERASSRSISFMVDFGANASSRQRRLRAPTLYKLMSCFPCRGSGGRNKAAYIGRTSSTCCALLSLEAINRPELEVWSLFDGAKTKETSIRKMLTQRRKDILTVMQDHDVVAPVGFRSSPFEYKGTRPAVVACRVLPQCAKGGRKNDCVGQARGIHEAVDLLLDQGLAPQGHRVPERECAQAERKGANKSAGDCRQGNGSLLAPPLCPGQPMDGKDGERHCALRVMHRAG